MSTEISVNQDINILTTEIRTITRQTQQMILSAAIEIGRRLIAAKELVPHGGWGDYLKNEVEFSQSTANNFMAVYKEYGDGQQNLFATNSQALGNLPYTKALRLLALPAEEREAFVESHDVDDMSVRELEKALKERDSARAQVEELHRQAEENREKLDFLQELEKSLQTAETESEKAKGVAAQLESALEMAKNREQALQQELKKLQENPEVPEKVLAKLRKETEAAAVEKTRKALEGDLAKAKAAEAAARKEKQELEAKLQASQKAAALSDPDAAVFNSLFKTVQEDFLRMQESLRKVEAGNPELGEKLKKAAAALLDKLREAL